MHSAQALDFAVIGPHHRGRISLPAHRPEDGLRLIAVCGLRLDNLDDYREKCGDELLITKDFGQILDHSAVNAVFICTPDHLHAGQAIAALQAGKHVFLEKPMAISIEDCDRILSAARESRGFTPGELVALSWLPFVFGAVANVAGGFTSDWLVKRIGLKWGRRLIGVGGFGLATIFLTATLFTEAKIPTILFLALAYGASDFALPIAWAVCLDVSKSMSAQ